MTSQSSEFILIVDDNPANLAVLSQTLKGAGHAVRVAVDGQSALEQIALELPTLILLDVMMPGIDGFGACRQLKENPATMEVPVIFMTALADSEHKVHGLSIGAADYITKPFNEAEVLARINVHLKLRKLLNTLSDQNRQLQQEIEKRQQAEAELQGLNEDLEQRVVARTKELQETHVKLVQQEKLSTLGELMTGVAHEINNPMGCIASNIQFVRDYTTQLMEHIELYQQQAPESSNDIHNHAENIDLEYIAEDLPNLIRSMQTSSDRIRAISNSLRIFARRDTQHKSEFNLHEGLDSTLLILKHRLKAQ
ncbi:MAG: response regulator, partial [Cyanobacteria bacterium J06636_16]